MLTNPYAKPTEEQTTEELARHLAHLARLDADLEAVRRRRVDVVNQVQRLQLQLLLSAQPTRQARRRSTL